MGHKGLRLGQIVHKLVFCNTSFSWLLNFHWTVSNLFFCSVTVKTIYIQRQQLYRVLISLRQKVIVQSLFGIFFVEIELNFPY